MYFIIPDQLQEFEQYISPEQKMSFFLAEKWRASRTTKQRVISKFHKDRFQGRPKTCLGVKAACRQEL